MFEQELGPSMWFYPQITFKKLDEPVALYIVLVLISTVLLVTCIILSQRHFQKQEK